MLLGAIKLDFTTMIPYLKWFATGTMMTIFVTIIAVICGTLIGFIATLMKRSKFKIVQGIANAYTSIIRGTPVLLQLYIIVLALPQIGIKIPDVFGIYQSGLFLSCVLALSLNSGAYICEILRAGLNSVDIGQTEAARSLGLDAKQTMRLVVVPQAIKTILPSLVNEFIMMIKESSLISTVGIADVMYTQRIIQGAIYRIFEPYLIIAGIYLILTYILTTFAGYVERKMNTDA